MTTTRDVDLIEKLRALLSEATPGPWEGRAEDGLAAVAGRGGWVMEGDAAPAEVDARLIAALRNLAPRLLALRARVDELEEKLAEAEQDAANVREVSAVVRAEDYEEIEQLRARVAELEAAHLAIAEAIDMVDHCEGQGAIVPDPSHVALTCGAMWRESLEAGEREDRARREGAEAMRERAVAALDRGVRLWPANSEGRGAAVAARETVRALPPDLDAGEESDR